MRDPLGFWLVIFTGVATIITFLILEHRRAGRLKPFWEEFRRRYKL